jgi:nitroreductase
MDILDVITSRRSIKHFLPKFISWEKISRIAEAGRHAPSSGNLQNWKFILVYKPEQKQQLAELTYGQHEIIQAWTIIVIVGQPVQAERYYGARGKFYTTQNCAAAAQNMLLEAHSLGLGGRWIGAFDEDAVKSMLGVPEEATVESLLAIGYAKEVPEKPPKYPLEPQLYFGGWRSRLRDPAKYMNDIAAILARKADKAKTVIKEMGKKAVGKFREVNEESLESNSEKLESEQ